MLSAPVLPYYVHPNYAINSTLSANEISLVHRTATQQAFVLMPLLGDDHLAIQQLLMEIQSAFTEEQQKMPPWGQIYHLGFHCSTLLGKYRKELDLCDESANRYKVLLALVLMLLYLEQVNRYTPHERVIQGHLIGNIPGFAVGYAKVVATSFRDSIQIVDEWPPDIDPQALLWIVSILYLESCDYLVANKPFWLPLLCMAFERAAISDVISLDKHVRRWLYPNMWSHSISHTLWIAVSGGNCGKLGDISPEAPR